jgi:TrmH family RNA methyltransferase
VNDLRRISSRENKFIKLVRSLENRNSRWNKNLFIIEGEKILLEAIEDNQRIEFIMISEKANLSETIIQSLSRKMEKTDVFVLDHRLFESISKLENSQGILAVVKFRLANMKDIQSNSILLYSDGIQDPGNLGTIIRTIDAFGLDGLILGANTVDPYNPKVIRATMGSIFRVPIFLNSIGREGILELKNKGFRFLATVPKNGIPVNDFDFKRGDIIVIGNEGRGVSDIIKELASDFLMINMKGNAESLNASIAASIIMYEISTKI